MAVSLAEPRAVLSATADECEQALLAEAASRIPPTDESRSPRLPLSSKPTASSSTARSSCAYGSGRPVRDVAHSLAAVVPVAPPLVVFAVAATPATPTLTNLSHLV